MRCDSRFQARVARPSLWYDVDHQSVFADLIVFEQNGESIVIGNPGHGRVSCAKVEEAGAIFVAPGAIRMQYQMVFGEEQQCLLGLILVK